MARELAQNSLLQRVLDQRKADILQQWQACTDAQEREVLWQAQRQLELLAGAIADAIRRAIADHPGGDT